MEKKLNYEEQINRLKAYYAVEFKVISEDEAMLYLSENTYYAKIRKYLGSFNCKRQPEGTSHRIALDFSHLIELAKLDMHLRRVVISLTLDIEHAMKTFFIRGITENEIIDEYQFVEDFISSYDRDGKIETSIEKSLQSDYSAETSARFISERNIWNLIESLSFNDFIKLFKFYADQYKVPDSAYNFDTTHILMFLTNKLRNAAAHNNALIHNLADNIEYEYNKSLPLGTALNQLQLKNKTRSRLLAKPITHDLCAAMLLLASYSSVGIQKSRFEDISGFLDRCKKNKQYFQPHNHLKIIYKDFVSFVDCLKKCVLTTYKDLGYTLNDE